MGIELGNIPSYRMEVLKMKNNKMSILLHHERKKTTNKINPEWSSYDKTVGDSHLRNYGIIFLDEYNYPIDDYDEVEELYNEYKKI